MSRLYASGITLIECVTYLALCALMSFLLFAWWVASHEHLAIVQRKTEGALAVRLLYQIVTRDISQANPENKSWHIKNNELKFAQGNDTITYQFHQGTLSRTIHKQGASKGAKGVIARALQAVSFTMVAQRHMVSAIRMSVTWPVQGQKTWLLPLKKGLRLS
jgi:hypothetical protein